MLFSIDVGYEAFEDKRILQRLSHIFYIISIYIPHINPTYITYKDIVIDIYGVNYVG